VEVDNVATSPVALR